MLSSARDHPYRSMRQRVSRWVHGWVRRWVVGWVGRRREKAGKLYVSQTGAEQKGSPPPRQNFSNTYSRYGVTRNARAVLKGFLLTLSSQDVPPSAPLPRIG